MFPSTLPKQPGTLVGIDRMPVDLEILKKMSDYNIDIEYALRCIEANRKNAASATYYLLLKSHLKAGGKSTTDARSNKYNPKVFANLKRSEKFR
jgi:5'-AMP-activated protein kinase catalytic alpha subunit